MNNNPFDYFKQIEQMGEQMRKMFGNGEFMKNFIPNMPDFFGRSATAGSAPSYAPGMDWTGGSYPRVDLYETAQEVIAVIEAPGLTNKGDIQLSVEPERILVKGAQSVSYAHVPADRFHLTERHRGAFQREIHLPVRVLAKDVQAFYKNGLLEVRMKKDPRVGEDFGSTIPISF